MTSVSAGHIILTPTQPIKEGWQTLLCLKLSNDARQRFQIRFYVSKKLVLNGLLLNTANVKKNLIAVSALN